MSPVICRGDSTQMSFPRLRGDEPEGGETHIHDSSVFPAYAGMSRRLAL